MLLVLGVCMYVCMYVVTQCVVIIRHEIFLVWYYSITIKLPISLRRINNLLRFKQRKVYAKLGEYSIEHIENL